MPKKVVFLRAKPIAPEPRVEKAAETLAQVGYTVTALGWDREGNHPHEEKRNGYTVHHIGPRGLHGGGIYNLLPMVLWQKDLFLWLWRKRHQYTHIHATDLDTILPALLIKLLLGKRVVYDIFDVFAFSRDLPDWMKALAHRLELWAIGKADAVILPDPSRREQILGARPKRLEVIINTPKLTNITLDMGHEGYESTHFRIAFVGFLDGRRWLKEMLNLVAKHPGWSFDLAGFGPLAEELREQASRLPNVRFHGRVSYTKALEIEAKAHVLFALYDPSLPNHRYSSPNKLFEAMALGKPILVARGTGMDTLVEEEELGYVVDYVSPSDVEKALEEIASWGPEKRKAFAQRTQSLFKERYSWEEMARRLLKLYGEV